VSSRSTATRAPLPEEGGTPPSRRRAWPSQLPAHPPAEGEREERDLILVVEDNKASSDLTAYLLRAAGHRVMTCTDGADAIAIAGQEHPRVIVMDLQLERMSGLEAAAVLAADPKLKAIPRVAVTAYAMVGDRDRVLRAGFTGYIAKPIEPTTFAAQIKAFFVPESPHVADAT
jgi:two-component system cell cycle response regulator DivK